MLTTSNNYNQNCLIALSILKVLLKLYMTSLTYHCTVSHSSYHQEPLWSSDTTLYFDTWFQHLLFTVKSLRKDSVHTERIRLNPLKVTEAVCVGLYLQVPTPTCITFKLKKKKKKGERHRSCYISPERKIFLGTDMHKI